MTVWRRRYSHLLFPILLFATPAAASTYTLSGAVLRDQFGKDHVFRRDAIGDRVVILGFTWGGCQTVCPITDQIMAQTQKRSQQKNKQFRLITVTLDRAGDPPKVMASRARQMGAGPGWLWLSGSFQNLTSVLGGLNAIESDLDAHPPRFMIIDGRRRIIREISGTPRADELLAAADAMLASRER